MEEKVRGKAGQFISKEQADNLSPSDLPNLISSSTKVTGALKDLKEAKDNEDVNKPLLKVEVNNPLSWFMKWLKDLKKRQTTTVSIRFGIPLIAIPVIILATGTLVYGIYRANFVSTPISTPFPLTTQQPVSTPTVAPKVIKIGRIKLSDDQLKVYLVVSVSEVLELKIPDDLDLNAFTGKKVMISGSLLENSVIELQTIELMPLIKLTPTPDVSIPTPPSPLP